MTIWTGKEAEKKMNKLEFAEAVPGYYDYTNAGDGDRTGTTSVVIRQADKQCLFFCSKRHFGSVVLDGTIAEFKALLGIRAEDIKEMIECATSL